MLSDAASSADAARSRRRRDLHRRRPARRRRRPHRQGADHARRGVGRGDAARSRRCWRGPAPSPADGRGLRPRDDRRHQRAAGGTRRPHRADRDPRLRRPARDRPPGPARTSTASARRSRRRWSSPSCASRRTSGSAPTGVVEPLADERAGAAGRGCCASSGAESVAICLLFSYLDPAHERRIAAHLRERLPGVHVSASHEVLPRFREYERCSTTAIDAYLSPLLGRYLGRLGEARRGGGPAGSRW